MAESDKPSIIGSGWGLGCDLSLYRWTDGTYTVGYTGRSRSGRLAVGETRVTLDQVRLMAESALAFAFEERGRV